MSVEPNNLSNSGYISEDSRTEDGLLKVSGVALGESDITRGHLSQDKKLWRKEVLEEAADYLEGKDIVADHVNNSAYETIGQVTDSGYKDGIGIIYQGVVQSDELEPKIEQGWLEVSPRLLHSEDGEELSGGVFSPDEIYDLPNLSIVRKGASHSNELNVGEHEELSIESIEAEFEEKSVVEEYQENFGENDVTVEELQLSEARTPTFEGTETSEEQSWGDVSKDLTDWVDALGYDAESVEDLTSEQKQTIANKTLLGDPEAESWSELLYFPVVNPNNNNLNEGALNAVRGGRGASADIPEDTYNSAENEAESLLEENFSGYDELAQADSTSEKKRIAGQISSWSALTRDEAMDVLEAIDPSSGTSISVIAPAMSRSSDLDESEIKEVLSDIESDDGQSEETEDEGDEVGYPNLSRLTTR